MVTVLLLVSITTVLSRLGSIFTILILILSISGLCSAERIDVRDEDGLYFLRISPLRVRFSYRLVGCVTRLTISTSTRLCVRFICSTLLIVLILILGILILFVVGLGLGFGIVTRFLSA